MKIELTEEELLLAARACMEYKYVLQDREGALLGRQDESIKAKALSTLQSKFWTHFNQERKQREVA